MSSIENHAQALYARLFNILRQSPTYLKEIRDADKRGDSADAEQKLGDSFLEGLKEIPNLRINIRGRGVINTPSTDQHEHYRVCIDPLDGASHYNQRGNTSGLSHAACVTVLKGNKKISTFSDIVAGGIVELRTGDMWTANRLPEDDRKKGSKIEVWVNHKPFKARSQTKLDLKTMTVFASMRNPEDRERILHAFGNDFGMIRNHGSVASEIAYVASGQAIACISSGQSHYSQGAGNYLLTGAGGVSVGLNGRDLKNDPFDLRLKTPAIFAANMSIAEQIVERINRQ